MRRRAQSLRDRAAWLQGRAAANYWRQLTSVDFINSSFAFAALAVLSVFPLLAVISAWTGGDVRSAIVARMGLSHQAARAVDRLIAEGNRAVATLTVFSGFVLVLGGIGMASTLQAWYERIYDQTPARGMLRNLTYQAAGIAAFSTYILLEVVLFDAVRPAGGRGLIFLLTFVLAVLFWWCSAYFLLHRRVPLRRLLPAGVATGICITGLGVVSSLFFSGQVVDGERSYGPAGVVIALITYLVGFGVCLHLGAVFGRVWIEWRAATEPDPEQVTS